MTISTSTRSRINRIRRIAKTPAEAILYGTGIAFRPYQDAPLRAILRSIANHDGDSIVIIFPRQSGKDEFLVNLKLYLSLIYSVLPVGIVEVNPTYKPQTITALLRFEQALNTHPWTRNKWRKRSDFLRLVGLARLAFLSGDKSANVVGATASLALLVNEAQDILPGVYDTRFEPMAASTNATRVFSGTVWTSITLLAREMRNAQRAQEADGRQRLFMIDAHEVAKFVPWYGAHVANIIKKKGRGHPTVKTQYFNEEIDAQAGMFNAARRALMQGDRPAQDGPLPGHAYAFLIDVAGQDEARMSLDEDAPLRNPGRDSLTLRIVDIDLSSLELLDFPTYRAVKSRAWIGQNHVKVFGQLRALGQLWRPLYFIIDATGVGEGLYAMLDHAFPSAGAKIPRVSRSNSPHKPSPRLATALSPLSRLVDSGIVQATEPRARIAYVRPTGVGRRPEAL